MRWPWPNPRKGDVFAILAFVVIAGGVLFIFVRFPIYGRIPNNGFGPEWDCTSVGKGDPVCIKKPPSPHRAE
jgi:hypothetical protein